MTPTRPTGTRLTRAQQAVLLTLRQAYPQAVSTLTLIEDHGPAVKTRIGELRALGWGIDTGSDGEVATYRLTSLDPVNPPRVVHAGCTITHTSRAGWDYRVHQEAVSLGAVPEAKLIEAAQAALAAYHAVVAPYLPPIEEEEDDWLDRVLDGVPCAPVSGAPLVQPPQEEEEEDLDSWLDTWLDSLQYFAVGIGGAK